MLKIIFNRAMRNTFFKGSLAAHRSLGLDAILLGLVVLIAFTADQTTADDGMKSSCICELENAVYNLTTLGNDSHKNMFVKLNYLQYITYRGDIYFVFVLHVGNVGMQDRTYTRHF